jgi:hypothetical protein
MENSLWKRLRTCRKDRLQNEWDLFSAQCHKIAIGLCKPVLSEKSKWQFSIRGVQVAFSEKATICPRCELAGVQIWWLCETATVANVALRERCGCVQLNRTCCVTGQWNVQLARYWVVRVTFGLSLGRCHVSNLVKYTWYLYWCFGGFPHSLQANSWTVPTLNNCSLLPNPFPLTNHPTIVWDNNRLVKESSISSPEDCLYILVSLPTSERSNFYASTCFGHVF